jgi:hemerythrin-like metal-binding protein
MTLIAWREEFKTGIPSLDHEHSELIKLLNDLHSNLVVEGDRVTVCDFLGEVYARISAHFALEERIMRERRYDQYQDHKSDHERLLDEIRDIMDGFESGDADFEQELSSQLETWFSQHFKTKDSRLHRLLGV